MFVFPTPERLFCRAQGFVSRRLGMLSFLNILVIFFLQSVTETRQKLLLFFLLLTVITSAGLNSVSHLS